MMNRSSLTRNKKYIKEIAKTTVCSLLLLPALLSAVLVIWAKNTWNGLEVEQIFDNINLNISFSDILKLNPEIKYYLGGTVAVYLILLAVCTNKKILCCAAGCLGLTIWQLQIIPYYYYLHSTGTLYENYYKAPSVTATDFPAKKRNLLLLYLESTENNFTDSNLYGRNLLPELSRIAAENPHFSNYNFLYGTNYTKAALVAGLCGIPYRSGRNGIENVFYHLKNITCLSDILAANGYETWFAKSADHSFAYTDIFYKAHGFQNIIDRTVLTENMSEEEIKKNESSYNGLADKLLFSHISNLFNNQQIQEPFLMTVFTVDTHAPMTVLPYNCPEIYRDIRDNILCSDANVSGFIRDFQKTPYWKNTAVVIVGDHPMFKEVKTQKRQKYRRGVYNAFLNLPDRPSYNQNKEFTAVDFAPTYAEILGIKLPEHAFGLGRSLFSDTPSLISLPLVKFKTAVRQKSLVYNTFNQLPSPQFFAYRLGEILNNRDTTGYNRFSEEVMGKYYVNGLNLKLDEIPTTDLEIKMTFNAMLSYNPILTITLNNIVLQKIKLKQKTGAQTVHLRIPRKRLTSPELAFVFTNNNFRNTIGQSVEIEKFVLRPYEEEKK